MTRADAAFVGTVTERRAPAPFDRSGQARYTFAVEQVYKGRLDSTITVMT